MNNQVSRAGGKLAVDGIPLWQFVLRVLLTAALLLIAYWTTQKGDLFFYQGF
ncbi:MAG: hypothetical protein HZA50_04210 [Planctomycetes bacterium]|nr:hypothetical protein [Planctomycetota bacterium]